MQSGRCFRQPLGIGRIDHVDERISVLEVVPPECPDLVLAADVPDRHVHVLVLELLDVETDGRDGDDQLVEFQLVQDGRLAGGVEAEHQDAARLRVAEHRLDSLGDGHAHGGWLVCG